MNYHEIEDRLTPIPQDDFILIAARAWARFYGRGPRADQLGCCLSQMVLESGREPDSERPGKFLWGKYAHNYCFPNIKHRGNGDPHHWQFYKCGEELRLKTALVESAKTPLVQIVKRYERHGVDMASVVIHPKHFWCQFRAYLNAEDAIVDYIRFLAMDRKRYLKAWSQVLQGNPVEFSKALSLAGYYTAPVERYTKTVLRLFSEFENQVVALLDTSEGRAIYRPEQERSRARILSLVGETMRASYAGEFEGVEELDEETARASITPNIPKVA